MLKIIGNTLLLLFVLGSWGILFSPMRFWVQKQIPGHYPKVLSVAYGDLLNNGSLVKVIKFRTLEGIVLEFYSEPQTGSRYLISRVTIPNAQDGFFDHRGQAVQLAIVDLDGDGDLELLAPTFDSQMIAYLNPYYFSPDMGSFTPFFLRDHNE